MDFGLIALRLAHVVAGAAWVGGAFVMILLVTRTARLRGADGDGFVTTLLTEGKAARYFEVAAITTVLAGGLLYFKASSGFQLAWITSPSGIGFSIGAAAAIVSLVWGGLVVGPAGKRAAAIQAEVGASGGAATIAQNSELDFDPQEAHRVRCGRSRSAGHGRDHDGDRTLLVIGVGPQASNGAVASGKMKSLDPAANHSDARRNDAALSNAIQLHAGDVGEADRQARGPSEGRSGVHRIGRWEAPWVLVRLRHA